MNSLIYWNIFWNIFLSVVLVIVIQECVSLNKKIKSTSTEYDLLKQFYKNNINAFKEELKSLIDALCEAKIIIKQIEASSKYGSPRYTYYAHPSAEISELLLKYFNLAIMPFHSYTKLVKVIKKKR
jgi:hypothetical protein